MKGLKEGVQGENLIGYLEELLIGSAGSVLDMVVINGVYWLTKE